MRNTRRIAASVVLLVLSCTSAHAAAVKVENGSPWAILHFHLSPVDENEWGPDQLGKEMVKPGSSFTLTDIECDSYDIKLVDEDGDECIVEDEEICGGNVWRVTSDALLDCQGYGAAAPKGGAARRASVNFVNRSHFDIDQLYLSPVDENEWGPDQLGPGVIASGASFTLSDIACDTYDIKLVDEDGDDCIVADVDLCGSNATWQLTDKELLGCEGYGD